jgi:hypothetical protein
VAVQEHPSRVVANRAKRRIWLVLLIVYAAAGIADGGHHFIEPPQPGTHSSTAANLAVAFCAGLFWPIDIVARPLLMSR